MILDFVRDVEQDVEEWGCLYMERNNNKKIDLEECRTKFQTALLFFLYCLNN